MLDDIGGITLPAKSRAQRDIPAASAGHCTANTVLGKGYGVRVQAESWTELCNLTLLNARRDVVEIAEQQVFKFGWDPARQEVHIFDVVITLDDGRRIAITVKPETRTYSRGRKKKNGEHYDERTFLERMGHITWWATVETNTYDAVHLVTERDFNKTDLRNAAMFAAVREPDPEVDAIALGIVKSLPKGSIHSLRDLTLETRMQARGYRALIRLIRDGILLPGTHEIIGPLTMVYFTGAL